MMKKIIALAVLVSMNVPAYAQNQASLCKLREKYKPVDSANYKPGVSTNGKAIAPADLNNMNDAFNIPDKVRIPLTIDMAQNMAIPLPPGTKMDTNFGMIDIYKDGRVVYNGKDITQNAVAVCGGQPVAPAAPVEAAAPTLTKPAAPAVANPVAITAPTDPTISAPVPEPVATPTLTAPTTGIAAPTSNAPAPGTVMPPDDLQGTSQQLNWGTEGQ